MFNEIKRYIQERVWIRLPYDKTPFWVSNCISNHYPYYPSKGFRSKILTGKTFVYKIDIKYTGFVEQGRSLGWEYVVYRRLKKIKHDTTK